MWMVAPGEMRKRTISVPTEKGETMINMAPIISANIAARRMREKRKREEEEKRRAEEKRRKDRQ